MKMGKEKIEDIIPKDVLEYHLSIFIVLQDIESKPLSIFNNVFKKFGQIESIIQSFVDDGLINEWACQSLMSDVRRRLEAIVIGDYSLEWLFMKYELETTIVTYDFNKGLDFKIIKRRQSGHRPVSLARSYLLASLCAEIKKRTNKPNYRIVADYFTGRLKEAGFDSKRVEVENRRIIKSGIIVHITDILSDYLPKN